MQVLTFNDKYALDIALCGGKGASLAKMTQAGFPVPQGFIVTAAAYQLFIEQAKNLDLNFNYVQLDILEQQTLHLRNDLLQLDLPQIVKQQIKQQLDILGIEETYSVRSSSTLEDLANSAFAGAHDTFLNVYGKENIYQKIKECFVSLWQTRAVAYRNQQGFLQENADMAVVVQKMIFAEKAGVSFAINPISGNFNEVLINANYGLGESVVCGEYNVDEYHIDKGSLKIITSNIAQKEKYIAWDNQGTYEKDTEKDKIEIACLNETELSKIAALNIAASNYYSFPQDIEWAIVHNEVYLLQSRPITTIQPHWTRDESAERYPTVITPLTWDYVDLAFHISLKHSFELMGLPPFSGKWFAMFDNYIYGDQNAVNLYMATPAVQIKSVSDLIEKLPFLQKRFAYAYQLPSLWYINLSDYLQKIGALLDRDLSNKSEQEIFAFIDELVIIGTEYFKPNIAISITQSMLYKLLMRLLQMISAQKSNDWFNALTTAQTKTTLVNEELFSLAIMINHYPALKEMILNNKSQEIIKQNLLNKFPAFDQQFQLFLYNHGHREVEFDSYIPTWIESPHIVLDNIRGILSNLNEDNLCKNKYQEIANKRNITIIEILQYTPKELQLFILEIIELVHSYTLLDDEEHYQTTRLTPVMRKGIFALGNLLVNKGVINKADDLFFAHIETLKNAVHSENYTELQQEVNKNKIAYLHNATQTPKWDLSADEEMVLSTNDNQLTGLPASAGIAEGEIYIVHSADDFANFPPNAILVAKTTNPAWTPLFYVAKALITESGGVLSHGAVTAREMKIPAVMAVRHVMQLLHNGQKVRVNGSSGVVEIL